MKFDHEYDLMGNHRLIWTPSPSRFEQPATGSWAPYTAPAIVKLANVGYFTVTEYFTGEFESDKVYEFRPYATAEPREIQLPNDISKQT